MPDGYAPAGRALAITVLTYDNASGRILDADIIVNGSYKFAVLRDGRGRRQPGAHRHGSAHPSNTDGISHQEEAPTRPTPSTTFTTSSLTSSVTRSA